MLNEAAKYKFEFNNIGDEENQFTKTAATGNLLPMTKIRHSCQAFVSFQLPGTGIFTVCSA